MDAEKYEKLKEKYNQVRRDCGTLKKGLVDKQEEFAALEQQLKDKDGTLKQQLEEIDHLSFQLGRSQKQVQTLTQQVHELQSKKQEGGWSMGLMSGKQQQELLQNAQNQQKILQEELMMKIQENEDLHIQMFDVKQKYEDTDLKMKEMQTSATSDLQSVNADLERERQKNINISQEMQEMIKKLDTTEEQCAKTNALAASLRSSLEEERRCAQQQISHMKKQILRWMPFDEAQYEPWNTWNCDSRCGKEVQRQSDSLQQLSGGVVETCHRSADAFRVWAKVFCGGTDEDSATRLRVRMKMSDVVEKLAGLMSQSVPEIVCALSPGQLPPSSSWDKQFKEGMRLFLVTHRKWVMYQSLLLLNDSTARGSRSTQEESQAQSFVECLWRLQRCQQKLSSRLKTFLCCAVLNTSSTSTSHFRTARTALGVPQGPDAKRSPEVSTPNTAKPAVPLAKVAESLLRQVRASLLEVLRAWEGVSRCVSSWAAAQGSDGNAVELLESLHVVCGCVSDRVTPAFDSLVADLSRPWGSAVSNRNPFCGSLARPASPQADTNVSPPGVVQLLGPGGYLRSAAVRLRDAPAGIGFEESVMIQKLAEELQQAKTRLSGEVREQVQRLRDVTAQKSDLVEELRALQDSHALLNSNLKTLQENGSAKTVLGDVASLLPTGTGGDTHSPDKLIPQNLVVSSRQRALLESLSVTAQESAGLRQHGFFVDAISLSSTEAQLAAGPPDMDSFETWELSVRKLYEQHTRNLQAQVRAADGKAMELYLGIQQSMDAMREQDEVKQRLREEVMTKHTQLHAVQEDMAMTQKNYDSQLVLLTEHICTLKSQLSENQESLAFLQAHRVLCGHCGMWNAIVKLLDSEAGICQTCKERVISKG